MVTSVTSSSASSGSSASEPSPAALQAKLDQYKKNLADCVNCSTAKTPEGKANIARIAASISRVEDSLSKGDTKVSASSKRSSSDDIRVPGTVVSDAANGKISTAAVEDKQSASALSTQASARNGRQTTLGTLGTQVDVYA